MFGHFTDRARRVIVLAQEESRMLAHNYVGTEHILLGLVHHADGVAASGLAALGVTLQPARDQVTLIIGRGSNRPAGPFRSPRVRRRCWSSASAKPTNWATTRSTANISSSGCFEKATASVLPC